MRDKNQDKRLWQALVGNDGRTALLITPGTEGLLTQQETVALVASLDPITGHRFPAVGRARFKGGTKSGGQPLATWGRISEE